MRKFSVKPKAKVKDELVVGGEKSSGDAWVYLGRLAETGPITPVLFHVEQPHVVSIVGKRGSGKSYTMGTILESLSTTNKDSSISRNKRASAALLFDTLGIFQWSNISLSEAQDSPVIEQQRKHLQGWSIEEEELDIEIWVPLGSNQSHQVWTREFSIRTHDLGAEDWGYLLDLDIYRDRMGQLINDVYIKVTVDGWTDGREHYPANEEYSITDLILCVTNDKELLADYHDETRRAVLQQLKTLHRNPIFADEGGTALSELLVPGRLAILVLNKVSEGLRLVIASALIRRLLRERTLASELKKESMIRNVSDQSLEGPAGREEIPPTWVAIDEAQNLLPAERRNPAGEMLVRFVREGRNYGLSFMVATQQPTAIDPRIMAQVDTLVVHRLAVQADIEYVKKNLKSSLPDEVRYGGKDYSFDDSVRSLDIGQAVVSSIDATRSYYVDIRPRVSVHGGF